MSALPRFDRKFLEGQEHFTVIGSGALGGKAQGLLGIRAVLDQQLDTSAFPGICVEIPRLTVLATDLFDDFMAMNGLRYEDLAERPDRAIALAFQKASLPPSLVGDLRALVARMHTPLAIRSSSLLEDAMYQPFAGVYLTKMIPNLEMDPDARFRKLVEAIKLVYASTFFSGARDYLRAADRTSADEKMAVIIQEVVGHRHGDRFYPHVSGVARSHNFYPAGNARPKEGVVLLALGLGRTIVEGGRAWSYSPAFPRAKPPFNSVRDLLQQTQTKFWAVRMGKPPEYDPVKETEYLVHPDLEDAEEDGALDWVASTYDPASDRIVAGLNADGPRVLDFAPLLVSERLPLNRALTALLACCEHALGTEVEIEFAATFGTPGSAPGAILPAAASDVLAGPGERTAHLGFLQVRPLVVSSEAVDIPAELLASEDALVSTESALGNGTNDHLTDIVYLRPDRFDTAQTHAMAGELEQINRRLQEEGRSYVLLGFGRWGTSDPWLGVPVQWGQIAQARVIVEASLPQCEPDPSQGSHFFHNVTSFRVLYFSVRHRSSRAIDWDWLAGRPAVQETRFARHVRLERPLRVAVDGRTGRGVILRPVEHGNPRSRG